MWSASKANRWLALALVLSGACHGARPDHLPAPGSARPASADGSVQSNILRSDYAGSATCAGCHAAQYEAWLHSPMHRMTRDVAHTEVAAPFADDEFVFRGDSLRMQQERGQRFMRLQRSSGEQTLFRVSKVIGGRYREDFVGREVSVDAPFGPALEDERVLPVSYLVFNGQYRYKGYSVMVRERPSLEKGVVWRTGCIFCHNSVPTLSLLLDDIAGPERGHGYQGSASVELPDEKRPRYLVSDEEGLKRALASERRFLGSEGKLVDRDLKQALTETMDATRARFDESKLVELGIGCETCHGGAREHVAAPLQARPSLALKSPFLRAIRADGGEPTHAEDVNRTCAKCHTVLFSRYPYTWEGRSRRQAPGGSTINSGEARDFALGDCNTQLSCVHCHDPHREDAKSSLAALETTTGDKLCTNCHGQLSTEPALRAHTHHAPESAGSRCINCHMPQKNMGLAYELTRYHRIGSPTDRERVEADRPLECALCHTDRSVDQLVVTMEKFWGKRYDRAALHRLYGPDLTLNTVEATLRFGKPHEQGTAVALAGRERRRDLLGLVARQLANDYPLVRYFARHAVERITGAPVSIDLNASGPEILKRAAPYLAGAAEPLPRSLP